MKGPFIRPENDYRSHRWLDAGCIGSGLQDDYEG